MGTLLKSCGGWNGQRGAWRLQNLFYVLGAGKLLAPATNGGAWQHPDQTPTPGSWHSYQTDLLTLTRPLLILRLFMPGGERRLMGGSPENREKKIKAAAKKRKEA